MYKKILQRKTETHLLKSQCSISISTNYTLHYGERNVAYFFVDKRMFCLQMQRVLSRTKNFNCSSSKKVISLCVTQLINGHPQQTGNCCCLVFICLVMVYINIYIQWLPKRSDTLEFSRTMKNQQSDENETFTCHSNNPNQSLI